MLLFRVEVGIDGTRREIAQVAYKNSEGTVLILDEEQTAPEGYLEFIPDNIIPYKQALGFLSEEYQEDIEKLNKAFQLSFLVNGAAQQTKQVAIRQQYTDRKIKYINDTNLLKQEYGV